MIAEGSDFLEGKVGYGIRDRQGQWNTSHPSKFLDGGNDWMLPVCLLYPCPYTPARWLLVSLCWMELVDVARCWNSKVS
jgi:hypothetical protein